MFKIFFTFLVISCLTSVAWAADTTTLDKQDSEFVRKAMQCNILEIRSSEIAMQRGLDGSDKEFAQLMIDDHKKAGKELQAIVERKGLTWDRSLDEKHQGKLDRIGKANDKGFSERYLENQISWHKDAVDLFEDQAENGKDADLKAFAIAHLPTLKNHLEHARKLEKMH